MAGKLLPPLLRFRGYYGDGYLAGEPPDVSNTVDGRVRVAGALARARVWVLDSESLQAVESVVSGANGEWQILYMRRFRADGSPQRYLLIGRDWTGTYNAAVQDWVTPVAMS